MSTRDAARFLRKEVVRVNGTAPSAEEIERKLVEGRRAFLSGYEAYAAWKDGGSVSSTKGRAKS